MTTSTDFIVSVIVLIATAFLYVNNRKAAKIGTPRSRYITPEEKKIADEQVLSFLMAGKKIKAIKLYREFYSVSLKEAKDAVESIRPNDRGK